MSESLPALGVPGAAPLDVPPEGTSYEIAGPGTLEQRHMRSEAFCNAADNTRVTRTHWHIAVANGLGWGFDGMDGVIFAVVTPMVIAEWSLTLTTFRSGLQIAMLIGLAGYFVWP